MNMGTIMGKCGINIKVMICSVFLCRFAYILATLMRFILGNSIVPCEQLASSPIQVFLVQCYLAANAIVSLSIMRCHYNTHTGITFPIYCVSGFHFGSEKQIYTKHQTILNDDQVFIVGLISRQECFRCSKLKKK